MEKTFDHLLGLSARSALAILAGYGITGVRVSLTGAPRAPGKTPPETQTPPARLTALEAIGRQFSVGDDDEEDDLGDALPRRDRDARPGACEAERDDDENC